MPSSIDLQKVDEAMEIIEALQAKNCGQQEATMLATLIEQFSRRAMPEFIDRIRNHTVLRMVNADGDQTQLQALRESLGAWYSGILFGDLLSYNSAERDSDKRIESRMRALVREALIWMPNSVFAQVLLYFKGAETPIVECTGTRGFQDVLHIERLRKDTTDYAKRNGSSVTWDIHFRNSAKWDWSDGVNQVRLDGIAIVEGDEIRPNTGVVISGAKAEFRIIPELLEAKQEESGGGASNGEEDARKRADESEPGKHSRFLSDVMWPFLKEIDPDAHTKDVLGLLHHSTGLDVYFDGLPDVDSRVRAHLYLASRVKRSTILTEKPVFRLPTNFRRTMVSLLSKLAHFYTVHRMIDQRYAVTRQAQRYDLISQPLERLTKAQEEIERDVRMLRNIMNEPADGILAEVRRLSELFREAGTMKFRTASGKITITRRHTVRNYEPNEALLILAEAIRRLLLPLNKSAISAKWLLSIRALLQNEYGGLADEKYAQLERMLGKKFQRVLENVNNSDFTEAGKISCAVLSDIKNFFLLPLKGGDESYQKPLIWPALFAYLPAGVEIRLSIVSPDWIRNEFSSEIMDSAGLAEKLPVICRRSNPFFHYGPFIDSFQKLVFSHMQDGSRDQRINSVVVCYTIFGQDTPCRLESLNLTESDGISVSFGTAGRKWIKDGGGNILEDLFTRLANQAQHELDIDVEYGNFFRPLQKLFITRRARGGLLMKCKNDHVKLQFGDRLVLEFNGSEFSIHSGSAAVKEWQKT